MNEDSILQRIVKIADETLGVFLSEEDSLKENGVDSLSLVALIVSIEFEFGISFSDDDLQPEKLNYLADLVKITKRYL